jgi:RNA polymerase sigma-70 factor (ECF subfamily)
MRVIDALYRTESRGVLATLIRLLGDFDPAEETLLGSASVDQAPRRQRP